MGKKSCMGAVLQSQLFGEGKVPLCLAPFSKKGVKRVSGTEQITGAY